jgi:hypothetical protein
VQYSDLVVAIGGIFESVVVTPTSSTPFLDTNWNNILPRAIEAGEQRMYRELDLLATRVTDASRMLTANNRKFTLPTTIGTFLVVEEVTPIISGVRQQTMMPVSRAFIDAAYPSDTAPSTPSIPIYWAMYDNANILVAPPPDSAYGVEVVGTQRPSPLSASNTQTILSTMLPDAFLAAVCVFVAGFQRDYGMQSDDPKMAMSWEAAYQTAMKSSAVEEFRKKWQGPGWSSMLPSPVASPPPH